MSIMLLESVYMSIIDFGGATIRQCWAIGQIDVLDTCPKPCPKPVQNQNLFSLDRVLDKSCDLNS